MVYWIIRAIIGPLIRFIWIKEVEGLENIPKKGKIILAANHASHLDFIGLGAVCPRKIFFLSKKEFFDNPFLNIILTAMGQIPVDRESKDKEEK